MAMSIEKSKIFPFPLPKRKVKPTIFPRTNPLTVPAHAKQTFSSFEEAQEILKKDEKNGKIISKRNKKKDRIEEILSCEEFETREEAERAKQELEVETDFSKVLVKIVNRKMVVENKKRVKVLFLSEWERDNYIYYLKDEGFEIIEMDSKEEPKIEVFSFISIYSNYDDAYKTLELLQKYYKREGKIVFLDDGRYEVFISGIKEGKDKLYVLEVLVSKLNEKEIYELEIKNCIKGYDYEIEYS